MIKFFFTLFLICCCFFQNTVTANIHPEAGHFGFQGEFLYLKPRNTSLNFAVEQISFAPFTVKSLFMKEKYRPGYRLEGVYAIDCLNNIHVRYTHYDTGSNIRKVTGSFNNPPFTGTLTNNEKFRFNNVEILYGRWLFDECDFELELQAGILMRKINYKDITNIEGPTTPFSTGTIRSSFWGVGPEFCLNFRYHLFELPCGLFSFTTDGRMAVLSGTDRLSNRSPDGFFNPSEPVTSLNPVLDLKLGLNWEYLINCKKFNLEVGYEWMYSERTFGISNISFAGPYIALGLIF